jgi:hypothetical protein
MLCNFYKTELINPDPIRKKTNTNFEITKEEIKPTQSHYNCDTRSFIKCPNCDEGINPYICCSNLLYNNTHDTRCMNYI